MTSIISSGLWGPETGRATARRSSSTARRCPRTWGHSPSGTPWSWSRTRTMIIRVKRIYSWCIPLSSLIHRTFVNLNIMPLMTETRWNIRWNSLIRGKLNFLDSLDIALLHSFFPTAEPPGPGWQDKELRRAVSIQARKPGLRPTIELAEVCPLY